MTNLELNELLTEQRNPKTMHLDDMSMREVLEVMNEEDACVAYRVKEQLPVIEQAVQQIIASLQQEGRLFYLGSGTSGRLGVLDAVECPPTFSTTTEVIGIIAGGDSAFVKAKEGAEDDEEQGKIDIKEAGLTKRDVLVGIAASGRTPHTMGALKQAKEIGAYTIAVSCNPGSAIGKIANLAIDVGVGPEVLTGSTRLKAGTAQKLVLNMLSTASMIGIGKTYQNLMVDLKPSNEKLVERSIHIIMEATGCEEPYAKQCFELSDRKPKVAIVMILLSCGKEEAEERLSKERGFVKKAIQ